MLNYSNELDRLLMIAEAICEVPGLNEGSDKLRAEKAAALNTAAGTAMRYLREGIRADLVKTVFMKKAQLLATAATVAELHEIMHAPCPHYTGGAFISGRYDIPEEELILWSLTSLKGPLVSAAFERYMLLFRQIMTQAPYNIPESEVS